MPTLQGPEKQLADALRATHTSYETERTWHRFLLDSYAGTGGFAGRVRQPFAAFWGSAAEDYARLSTTVNGDLDDTESRIDTYLERFPREDAPKFARRVAVSVFHNYCEPIVDLRASYLNRKPMTYEGVGPLREGDDAWWERAGLGLSWDDLMTSVVRLRALVLGWVPVLVDAPPAPSGEMSVAQARDAGVRARVVPLYPSNLLDWQFDEETGELLWAKLRTCHVRRADFMAPGARVERFTIWTRDTAATAELMTSEDGSEELRMDQPRAHAFGRVPLVIFRAKPAPNDPLRGLSIIGSVAPMNRKLFNYVSELDEHLRSCVFGMLQVPMRDSKQGGTVVTGNANALLIDPNASRDYKWISPDGAVASTYEARIAKQVDEIHRVGRNESGGAKQVAKSGVAQAYDFEGMNRAISDNAASLARAEQETLRLVATIEASSLDQDSIRVIPATKFDVEEMAKDLEEALTAIDLGLGMTATTRLKQRLARKLLPNLSEEDQTAIDSEIEELAKAAEQAAQAMQEELAAGGAEELDADEPDEPGDEQEPEARPPAEGPPRAGERTQRPGRPRARGAREG